MRQGRMRWWPCAAMALGLVALSFASPGAHVAFAASSEAKTAKASNGLRQFTGVVTALDKTTLTVEKRGKNPRTVVFTRHSEMKTTGAVEKNSRVTVYYRDDGGRSIAHRVVVRPDRPRAAGGGH